MSVTLRFECHGVNWEQAASVFERAPLGTREPEKLKRTFEKSSLVCFAYDKDIIVGLARALSDFEAQAVIYDLNLLPKYQGKGLGTRIMKELLERLNVPTIMLYAVPGKEAFYKHLGFHSMNTAMGRFVNLEKMRQGGYVD